jgi:hypothetical protein
VCTASADVSLSEVSAPLIVSSSIGMGTLAQTRTAQAPMYKHESTTLLLRRTGWAPSTTLRKVVGNSILEMGMEAQADLKAAFRVSLVRGPSANLLHFKFKFGRNRPGTSQL